MVLPAVILVLVLILHAGVLAADAVAAQGFAREAARVAAVDDDAAVREALDAAAGSRPVDLDIQPAGQRSPGSLVTVQLRVRSRAFDGFGFTFWLPARATMRVEA